MENNFGRAPKFVRAFPFGQTVFFLIYSLSSIQWCPSHPKKRLWSHYQHFARLLDHRDRGWSGIWGKAVYEDVPRAPRNLI